MTITFSAPSSASRTDPVKVPLVAVVGRVGRYSEQHLRDGRCPARLVEDDGDSLVVGTAPGLSA
jgi:hypothetical protein